MRSLVVQRIVSMVLTVLGPLTPAASLAEDGVSIVIEVEGFETDEGRLRCGLFLRKGWPEEEGRIAGTEAVIEDRRSRCVFTMVTPGRYGVAVFHDENGNGKLDKNLFGIPTEDYCFSRGASGTMGPPSFASAALDVAATDVRTSCRL